MIDRREFLATSVATMSLPMVGSAIAAVSERKPLPFDRMIVDARIADHEALSDIARASAVPSISIRGDLPKLWFESLRGALLEAPNVIAGITSDLDAEVMRAFARDVQYQQQLRADITIDAADGRLTVRHSGNLARSTQSAVSSGFENLINYYTNVAMPVQQHALTQLTAWVVAPIRG